TPLDRLELDQLATPGLAVLRQGGDHRDHLANRGGPRTGRQQAGEIERLGQRAAAFDREIRGQQLPRLGADAGIEPGGETRDRNHRGDAYGEAGDEEGETPKRPARLAQHPGEEGARLQAAVSEGAEGAAKGVAEEGSDRSSRSIRPSRR